jgi:pantetheine-phosphate adenylyltransferase
MKKAVFPGSFDPVTNGHIDVMERAVKAFDEIVVGVAGDPSNPEKQRGMFTLDERIEMIEENTRHLNITVMLFSGLLVDFCKNIGADCVVKGIRVVSDFDYEMQMSQMNARMGIETLFVPTSAEYAFIASSLMKEVVALGGDISGLVPASVEVRLKEKLTP